MKKNIDNVLMPINQDFFEVFDVFMDENQRAKIRANNVRQYVEGIIDLLLRDIIEKNIKANEPYEGINWGRKQKIIKEKYSEEIAGDIEDILRIGGNGSHFNGQVSDKELQDIIDKAVHIVDKIFVQYFLQEEHKFGKENIYTFFSMLPLKNRIYILESVYKSYQNEALVDRLSLAYAKDNQEDKAVKLLDAALKDIVVDNGFYQAQKIRIQALKDNLAEVQNLNKSISSGDEYMQTKIYGNQMIVGLPSSRNTFDVKKAVFCLQTGFEETKKDYPEFVNLFLYLMQTDERTYTQ